MTAQELDLSGVTRRLELLERENRWMKSVFAVVLVLAGGALLMASQPQGKTGEPLVFRDDKGNERAWLGMAKDGPLLRFRDDSGKERLWLGLAKNTPGIVFYDELGKRRAALSTGKGAVSFVFYDGNQRRRAWLVMSDAGPALHFLGGKGGPQHAGLSVEEEGVAVWHHDKAGRVHSGITGLRNVAGSPLHGEIVDPLFPNPD